jgi:hypothetical protein
MTNKGFLTLVVSLCGLFLGANSRAEEYGVRTDLWDVHNGAVLTAHSPLISSESDPGIFGGDDTGTTPVTTIFADGQAAGFVHFVEWRTPTAVSIDHIKLYAAGDGAVYSNGREFGRFTLKVKSPGSAVFDTTVTNFIPTHPYTSLGEKFLVLDATFAAVTAREFRAEFEQINLRSDGWNAPRVIELDGFGAVSPVPAIITDPQSQTVWAGETAIFSVEAAGQSPLSYLWKHDNTNVVLSSHIESPDGKTLRINNATVADAGPYSVLVTNVHGQVESANAALIVRVDTNAPNVAITSPTNGLATVQNITLAGTFSDDQSLASARWERNGAAGGSLSVSNGTFSVSVALAPGENRLKVIATDLAGNEGSAEVVVSISPTAQSQDDLWDVSRGTIVTGSSGIYSEPDGERPGMFGGAGFYGETGSTLFADDKPEGFDHYIEWKTLTPVSISTIRLYGAGDGEIYNNEREFQTFRLKTKSPGSTNFDVIVCTFVPQHPYVFLDPATSLVLETNVPAFTAQEFRGEFVQYNGHRGFDGPRVIELDAFGPSSGGAPQIVNQPVSKEQFVGANVTFLVGATGASPLTYQWRYEGTNLVASDRIIGVNSWSLTIKDVRAEDAGKYSVVVSNGLGEATSSDATLTVAVDTVAPVVTITSPAGGAQTNAPFTLEGTIAEANSLASVTWEFNGRQMGAPRLIGNQFFVTGVAFEFGENHIRVTATDTSGNVGSAEVVATWTAPRALVLQQPTAVQEGARVVVPISMVSTGGVAGATFLLRFDTNYLADVQLEWADSTASGFTTANFETANQLRASFALPGTTLAQGTAPVALLNFRARSVPTNITTQLRVDLVGIYDDAGEPYTNNNFVQGTSVKITKRKVIADVNANNRLDVGDASLILRLVSRLDPVRFWDRTSNDLNKNGDVDSGDVIRVLRAVVGLDSQPVVAALASGKKIQTAADEEGGGSGVIDTMGPMVGPVSLYAPGVLVADKATANPGEKVTLEVRLPSDLNGSKPLSGASFRLKYPVDALKLENASAQAIGSLVPSGAVAMWNVSPNQNNYATQDGTVSFAVSTANAWPGKSGVLARLTFTVQPGATTRYGWPVYLESFEVSRDGFATEFIGNGLWTFTGHAATQATLSPSITFAADGKPTITLQGDAGASFSIEASSDLKTWTPIGSYSSNGTITIQDHLAGAASERFYRAIQLPN